MVEEVDQVVSDYEGDRNPSPPLHADHSGDEDEATSAHLIGSTVFSQKFVLECLLDILKDESSNPNGSDLEELNEEFEERLNQLWDMSTHPEVGCFLLDSNVLSVFSDAIKSTRKPRLTEILIGISGNLACSSQCVPYLIKDHSFLITILRTLSYRDIPTLRESYRFLSAITETENLSGMFWKSFDELSCMDDISFVLSSTTNKDLLRFAIKFVDNIIDQRLDVLSNASLVGHIISAVTELLDDGQFEAIATAMHLTHSLVTHRMVEIEPSVSAVACIKDCINETSTLDSLEHVHLSIIASCIAVWNCIIEKHRDQNDVKPNEKYRLFLIKLHERLKREFGEASNEYLESSLMQLNFIIGDNT